MSINAYAAAGRGQHLLPFQYEPEDLGPFDVEVKITHCGICHSDLHLIDDDWEISRYPLVPGHEIIGMVMEMGDQVDPSLMGRRVGIGWQRGACLNCSSCLSGEENLCRDTSETCVENHGGFAEAIRVDSRFVHPIPASLPPETAAPLLCAGVTTYAPLRRHTRPGMRVGIVGIGGLGHLAVQFANKFGCEVVAFSSSPAKAGEAQALGAHFFVNSRDGSAMRRLRHTLDYLLVTVTADLDWNDYLKLLRANGTMCFVGVPSQPLRVDAGLLIDAQRSVTASSIGGRAVTREMLAFAARHDIQAWVENMPHNRVNEALYRLRNNDVRYRFVLEW